MVGGALYVSIIISMFYQHLIKMSYNSVLSRKFFAAYLTMPLIKKKCIFKYLNKCIYIQLF